MRIGGGIIEDLGGSGLHQLRFTLFHTYWTGRVFLCVDFYAATDVAGDRLLRPGESERTARSAQADTRKWSPTITSAAPPERKFARVSA
jgi:hypothetical protein